MIGKIRYTIATGQDGWGEKKWGFFFHKYMRVIFKRSKREGWRFMGVVRHNCENQRFDTRAEALACARAVRRELEAGK